MKNPVIYIPRGAAREYAAIEANANNRTFYIKSGLAKILEGA